LAKYFEKVLKILIYKFKYEFNQKCPLLTLLFQYTHKYNFLHQKLIDVVHQDIDQQQAGIGNGGSMAVSNSFMIFQLHWDAKQLRISQEKQRKLREHKQLEFYKAKLFQKCQVDPRADYGRIVANEKLQEEIYKLNTLEKAQKFMRKTKMDFASWDPYVLNDYKTSEWTFNQVRLDVLADLAKQDAQ